MSYRGGVGGIAMVLAFAACTNAGSEASSSAPAACVDGGGATGAMRSCPVNSGGPGVSGPGGAHPLADLPEGEAPDDAAVDAATDAPLE